MKKIYLLLIAIAFTTVGFGQIAYFNNFDNPVPSGTSYTGNPTLATNISGGAWTTSAGSFSSFGGATGNALSLTNSGGTPTMTLTLTVAAGFKLDLSSYDFWRQRSSTGAQNYSIAIAGNSAGSGIVPITGAYIGTQNVAINNITGTFTVVLTVSGASSGGTFRLDDFQLNGVISSLCTQPSNQATNYSTTSITSTSATLNWTRPAGGGDNVLVVMRLSSAVSSNPSNGTNYAANPAFGSGAQIGTGNFVVYNGTASTVNVTGLSQGNSYNVAIYEYNNASICYKTPALTGNFSTPCPTFSLPFTEGFEAAGFPPSCWATFRGANNTGTFFDWTRSTTSRTGTGAAFVRWESNSNTNEDWLVTPAINLTNTTTNTLTYYNRGDNFTGSTYSVRVSTTSQTDRSSFVSILSYASPLASTYVLRTVDLSAYSGSNVFVAFVMTNNNGDSWYIDDVSITGTTPANSFSSNIVDNNFTPTSDINYSAFSAASGLTTGNAIKIGEFRIQDGGNTLNDTDALSTTLTSLGLNVQNFGDIRALAIFDETTNVREVTSVTGTNTFNTLNLVANDNSSKVFSVYATFKTTVTDNNQIRLTIASATANPAGSTFAAGNAGGAQTSITGDANRIEVTATALAFVQQPTFTIVNEAMVPAPTVRAIDVNLNRDLDFVSTVSVSTSGTFAGSATTSATAVAGIATFNNLRFSAPGTGLTLTTVSGLTNATSSTFDVSTVGWQIGAVNQLYTIDFDNTVANVNNGAYAGSGFTPTPGTGQLNSGAWAVAGITGGPLDFGGTKNSGDFANGTSTGGVTTGGLYAFQVAPNNYTFGVQPTGSTFAPGTVTLKVQNQTGQMVTSVRFQYIIYVRNDQGRSNSFNFSYSYNDATYANATSLDYTSPEAITGNSWIAVPRDLTVTGLNIPAGSYIYARWSSDDVAGGGSRDEFGLDDIQVIFDPVPANNLSDIVATTAFVEPSNINNLTYSAPSGLTTGNAVKIGEFRLRDGGDTMNDSDILSTQLTDLSLSVQNFNNIAALAIFDGTTNIKEVTSVTATTTFNNFTLTAADNSSKVFSIYATFKPTVTDNEQLRLTISSAVASIAGSGFAAADAGGAQTSIADDRNRIEVTASALSFGQQPTNTSIDITMAPAPTVRAVDANANLDLDYVTSVSLSTTGTFSGAATTIATPVAGIATFGNLKLSEVGTAFTLTTISGLTNATSGTFDVSPVGLQIDAVNQLYTIDFDNTVTNVNNGAYTGSGFTPSPTSGQLNSGAWASTGMSDGALDFGDIGTSGDFARGTSPGGVTTEGFYSFVVSPGNATFGIQPGANDFTPGNVRLKVQNQTGQTVTSVRFQYIIYVRNDQDRSSALNFSYSYDDALYGTAPSLNYLSPEAATGTDWIAVPRDLTLTGLNIPDGSYIYARWNSNDVAGSGDRDELALDDIQVIFDPVPANDDSNIVATPGFDEPDNIDYLSYSAINTLTTVNAIKIGEFSIQDGGDALNDTDNLPTILTDLGFTVQNFGNLAALAIFDGASNVSEVTTVSGTTLFTDLNLTAADNSNKVFSVYATFKSAVTDNQQIQLSIASATASITGSGFASSDAGGAQTSIDGNDNRIEVLASLLSITQQPSDVVVGQSMAPAVTVSAVDTNGNLDVDYTTDVSVTSTGTLSGSPVTVAPSAGVATFNNLVHTAQGTGLTLTVSSGTFTDVVSDPFNVTPGVDYVYSNGWTPGDPSGVSNSSDTILIQLGSTSITAPTQAAEVTIDAGTSLTIAPDASMDIANNLTNNGTLTLQSTSAAYSSIVAPSVSGTGTNNYNRHVNVNQASGGNDLISAPFTGQTFGDFAAANTNIVTDPNNANRKLFGPFNKATGTYQIYNVVDDAAVTLDAGIGYRAASTDNGTFTFTGTFNTANVNTAITVGGPQFQIWNLIGNPYSSYIKLADFLALNASKFHPSRSGVYGYNGTAGGFEIWNSAYSLANPNAIITPGQGFLVASGSPSETVNFTSDMRATGNSDDFIPNRLSTQPIAHLQIGATMASNTYRTDFYFTDLATLGLDPGFDSGVFGTNASSRAIYSQLVQGNQGVDMGIQSIAYSDLWTDVRVPLGINVPQGEQVAVSIAATTLPQDVEVYLEDSMANSFTLLNSSSYVFTPNTNLASTGRFFLRFSSSTLSNGSSELDGLQIYAVKRVLHINGLLNAETKVTIHDLQGRAVMTDRLQSGSANNTIDVSSLSSGIYVVKLHNGSQQKNQKIIVK